VRVSASFQIFALTAGEMCWVGREIVLEGEMSGKNMSEVERPEGNVLHAVASIMHSVLIHWYIHCSLMNYTVRILFVKLARSGGG